MTTVCPSTSVILSEAKDLMPVATVDEILRFAQDDRSQRGTFVIGR
jgi:hypothetical protein